MDAVTTELLLGVFTSVCVCVIHSISTPLAGAASKVKVVPLTEYVALC